MTKDLTTRFDFVWPPRGVPAHGGLQPTLPQRARSSQRLSWPRRIVVVLARSVSWPVRVARQRRIIAELAVLDDRGLADIGLSRQDLRDASALAIDADPSEHLQRRARERRSR